MILVTTGSTLPDDKLIEYIDNLVGSNKITERVIAQIGTGQYIPKHCRYFRFANNITDGFAKANIIISSCGAGTIFENVKFGRRLIVIQNTTDKGDWCREIASRMEDGKHIIWCRDLQILYDCIEKARTFEFQLFISDPINLKSILSEVMEKN